MILTGWILCTQIAFTDGVYPYCVSQKPAGLANNTEASNTSGHEPMVQCSIAAVLDSFEVDNFGHLVSVLHQLVFSLTWDVLEVELSADAALCVNLRSEPYNPGSGDEGQKRHSNQMC